jgi:lysophospholipase L1-like esterase
MRILKTTLLAALCAVVWLPQVASADDGRASRWQAEFTAFSQADEQRPPQRGGVVFVGSSSIRLWDGLESQFERFPVILKRGFGGSTMTECAENVHRLVLAYEPHAVVIYAGENDLVAGMGSDEVLRSVQGFTESIRRAQPYAHIAYVSIKPSPLRASLLPAIRETNDRIRAYLGSVPNAQFIDVYSLMLDERGLPRAELFREDRLHLNATGYALWRREINARLP